MPFAIEGKRIYVAGHGGLVGSALCRRLEQVECTLLTATRAEVDLTDQGAARAFLADARPDAVIVAAAKVGGIAANASHPAEFIYDNLQIAANVIDGAHRAGVNRLLFLGSSCIYPRLAPQPLAEEALLSGPLEPTNQWYAIAKIAGIKLAQAFRRQYGRDYISANPTNLYGPGDNFDLASGHVLPALIRKAHEARLAGADGLTVWGSGTPLREFLHADDCADACIHLLRHYSDESPVNIGSGEEISIAELARLICRVVGFAGTVELDPSQPDGTPRKLVYSGRLEAMGWKPAIGLEDGIRATYAAFLKEQA